MTLHLPFIASLSLRALVVASCVGLILSLARVRSGAMRHAAWAAVLFTMLALPVFPNLSSLLPRSLQISVDLPEPLSVPAAPVALAPATNAAATLAPTPLAAVPSMSTTPQDFPFAPGAWSVYLLMAAALFLRDFAGWRAARHMYRNAAPIVGLAPALYESTAVIAPLVAGIIRPRVLVPSDWRAWPEIKRRAVLAHEGAHIQRRDPLIAAFARLNRCIFWFHPLSWWLERKLASTAEQACDDAAAHALGDGHAYAELLLEIAESVHRSGGRLQAAGIGIAGREPLEHRIDRILRADFARPVSRLRAVSVAAACTAAVLLIAGCNRSSDAALVVQSEQRERGYKQSMAKTAAHRDAINKLQQAGLHMSADQAASFEESLRRNPDDAEAHKQLLLYYFFHADPRPATPPKESPAWSQLFWMIEHHPDDPLVFSASEWRLTRPVDSSLPAHAAALWNDQADRDNQPAAVYANAFLFFRLFDAPSAEKALIHLRSVDPTGDATPQLFGGWAQRFGELYGTVLLYYATRGSVDFMTGLLSSAPDASAAYAAQVSQILQQSTDVPTILMAASRLVGMTLPDSKRFGDIDPLVFGQQLIQRALSLQPNSAWAHQLLNVAADRQLIGTIPVAVWQGTLESRHAAIESLPAGVRFRELTILAIAAADRGVRAQLQFHVPAAEQDAWSHAASYAREALALAPQAKNHPDYGTAFFNANMILGVTAVRSGDTKAAVYHLRQAATAPVTPALQYPIPNARPWSMNWHFPDMLLADLLKAGQKDAVIDFLERYSKIDVEYRTRYLESIALIRQGKTPAWARS